MSDTDSTVHDTAPDSAQWSVRGIPHTVRNAVLQAARREKIAVGEWLHQAIVAKIKADRDASKAIVAVPQMALPSPQSLVDDLEDVRRIVETAQGIADITARPMPPSVNRLANRVIREKLAALHDVRLTIQHMPTDKLTDISCAGDWP